MTQHNSCPDDGLDSNDEPMDEPQTTIQDERPARGAITPNVIVKLAAFVIVVGALKLAQSILVPLVLAMFLTVIMLPIVRRLENLKLPTGGAIALVLLGALIVAGAFGLIIASSVGAFSEALPGYKTRIGDLWLGVVHWLDSAGVSVTAKGIKDGLNPGSIMSFFGDTLSSMVSGLSTGLLIALLVVFMALETAGLPAKLGRAFDGDIHDSLENGTLALEKIQRYLGIKTLVSLGTGVCVTIGLAILGIDFAILWGICAFFLNYIPNVGSLIAAVPPMLLAVVQFGPLHALSVGGLYFVINFGFGNVLEPKLLGKQLGLSPLVVFVALIVWGWLWGPIGMLLSVPLTSVAQIMLQSSKNYRWIAVLLGPSVSVHSSPSPK